MLRVREGERERGKGEREGRERGREREGEKESERNAIVYVCTIHIVYVCRHKHTCTY